MSFFEDARSKWRARFKDDAPLKPNPYFQGYLGEIDSEFLRGYDWVMEKEFINWLYNIGASNRPFEDVDFDLEKIDTDVICSDQGYDDYSEDELAKMSKETKLLLMLADDFVQWVESSRDQLVTSMIEAMDDDKYQENFKKVWGMSQEEAEEHEFTDTESEEDN